MKLKILLGHSIIVFSTVLVSAPAFAKAAQPGVIKQVNLTVVNSSGTKIPYFYTVDNEGFGFLNANPLTGGKIVKLDEGKTNFQFNVLDPSANQSNIVLNATMAPDSNVNSAEIYISVNNGYGNPPAMNSTYGYGNIKSKVVSDSVTISGIDNVVVSITKK